jgi:predicted RecA/RadA family phage recombinase
MRNLLQDGLVIPLTAPDDVEPGDLVNVGAIVGVAVGRAMEGETVQTRLQGVFNSLPTTSSETYTPGTVVYYNASTKRLTTSSSGGNVRAGVALGSGRFRLNGSF